MSALERSILSQMFVQHSHVFDFIHLCQLTKIKGLRGVAQHVCPFNVLISDVFRLG